MARRVAGITAAALLFGTVSGGTMVGVNMLADSMKQETYPQVSQSETLETTPQTQAVLPPSSSLNGASSAESLDVSAIVENANFNGTNGAALPMGSVDIDPVDVTNMLTRPDIWTAAGTTDWTLNGEIGMRILMLEIAGEYDKIYDPASGQKGVDVVEVPGSAILASSLKDTSTVENLGEIADETYGNLDYLSVADWMPADLIH